jgi:iron complex outermembrane receptor protein
MAHLVRAACPRPGSSYTLCHTRPTGWDTVTADGAESGDSKDRRRGPADGSAGRFPAWVLAGALLAACVVAQAQDRPLPGAGAGDARTPRDLSDLSLEQLGNIVVTSVSRQSERLSDVSSSIFVISAQDIHRSGATTLGEALRLAPNLNVGRADTSQYAISARGFNDTLANKMLVLIDGRTVYSPLFSGVFWEVQDVMLEDVDRIEVISGPGATIWGSNAVNGVINIITLPARETQGGLVSLGAGNRERGAAARYGGKLGENGHYRVYAKTLDLKASDRADGRSLQDRYKQTQAGMRAEWRVAGEELSVHADVYDGEVGPFATGAGMAGSLSSGREFSGTNLVATWNKLLTGGGNLRVRGYYDRTERDHSDGFSEQLDTFDLEFQHLMRPMGAHRLTWGAGHRDASDDVVNSALQAFVPARRHLRWRNIFVQDEVALQDDVSLTLGIKVEENPFTGSEILPSTRLSWRVNPRHTLWAGISRAVRAPSRIDREVYFPGNPPYVLVGNDSFRSEVSNVYQLGYRGQPGRSVTWSATAFYHDHSRLRSLQLQPGGAIFANDLEGRTTGIETWGSYQVSRRWRLNAGLVLLDQDLRLRRGATDAGGNPSGGDPSHWWMVRSSFDISADQHLDVTLRRVGALKQPAVPGYTAVDARYGWTFSRDLEAGLVLRNLFDARHAEWGGAANRAEHERSFLLQISWRL